jgi:hypothetical protein
VRRVTGQCDKVATAADATGGRSASGTVLDAWSIIWKSVQRFSEKHALGLDPRDHAQSKSYSAMMIQADPIAL